MLDEQVLVDAKLYPDRRAVIQDALRALLREKPQLRVELAIHRYETEDISLAHAAHLAGVRFDRMKTLMVERGVQLRLRPADEAEARQEIVDLGRVVDGARNGQAQGA
jgi:predicted HTH domain antitoxin